MTYQDFTNAELVDGIDDIPRVRELVRRIADLEAEKHGPGHHCYWTDYGERQKQRADQAEAERDALRDELCNVIRQWSDDYLDLVGYPVDVTELSALAQAVWAAASATA